MTDQQTKQLSASLARLSGKTITILAVLTWIFVAESESKAEQETAFVIILTRFWPDSTSPVDWPGTLQAAAMQLRRKCLTDLVSFVLYSSRPPFRQPEVYMARIFVRIVTIVLALWGTVSIKSFAQTIGPDGRVLPAYSGGYASTPTPAPAAPTVTPPTSAPTLSTIITPTVALAPVTRGYLRGSGWYGG
jgi:hypothetical protein